MKETIKLHCGKIRTQCYSNLTYTTDYRLNTSASATFILTDLFQNQSAKVYSAKEVKSLGWSSICFKMKFIQFKKLGLSL